MTRFYSQQTGCTYIQGFHTDMPTDAKEITEECFNEVLGNPAQNKVRGHDDEGLPILIDPSASDLNLAAKQSIASRRYTSEVAGITVDGMSIDTGRDSQALIVGASLAAVIDPAYICNWKTAVGFVELSSAQLINIATAVRSHVQACFDREGILLAALEGGSFTPSMLEEDWPV